MQIPPASTRFRFRAEPGGEEWVRDLAVLEDFYALS